MINDGEFSPLHPVIQAQLYSSRHYNESSQFKLIKYIFVQKKFSLKMASKETYVAPQPTQVAQY